MIPLVSSGLLDSLSASGKVKGSNPYNEKRLLEQNKKMQAANNVPNDFPSFIREGNNTHHPNELLLQVQKFWENLALFVSVKRF